MRRPALACALAVATLIGTPACSSPPAAPEAEEHRIDTPAFTGPNAGDFESAWRATDSEFVRGIIADEQISDQEWAEVTDRLRSCIADQGMDFTGFNRDRSYGVDLGDTEPEKADALLLECEKESGEHWAGYLRWVVAENPQGQPIEELMTDCLIRAGVVESSYTPQDYLRDVPTLDFPYVDAEAGPEAFWLCNDDPSAGP